jgi:hypothetical protein
MPDIVQLSNVQLTHQSNIKNINIYGISQHASHLLKIVQAPHNNEFSKNSRTTFKIACNITIENQDL